jgi:hypothetical protein
MPAFLKHSPPLRGACGASVKSSRAAFSNAKANRKQETCLAMYYAFMGNIPNGAGEDVSLDWPQTLAAIYPVRCNLFHGEKSAHLEMDREIVCTALVVLMMFFRHSQIL